jgi:hypothetical protein
LFLGWLLMLRETVLVLERSLASANRSLNTNDYRTIARCAFRNETSVLLPIDGERIWDENEENSFPID